jgi:hypothetical protein
VLENAVFANILLLSKPPPLLLLLPLQVVPLMVVETRKEVDEVSCVASKMFEASRRAVLLCVASSQCTAWY